MCLLSNIQGVHSLHIERKLWYVIKNFHVVRLSAGTRGLAVSRGEMPSGHGHEY